jgi:hypothetical protein
MLLTVFISKFATKIPLPPLPPPPHSPLAPPLKILIQEFKNRKMKSLKEFKKGRSLDHNNRLKGLGHQTDWVLVGIYG